MRIVIVGGGVIGLLTAIECVRNGAQVELVDHDGIPGRLAISNDRYRIVRAFHHGDPELTAAAARGRRDWADLERMLGTRFYLRTGVLTVMAEEAIPASLRLLDDVGVPAREVPAAALPVRYPQLRPAAGQAAVLEPDAAAVLASEALAALASWLREQPAASLRPGSRVTAIGESATVRLDDGSILAGDGVVVAAGPWSAGLLPAGLTADLTLLRQTMLTYAPPPAWAGLPAIIGLGQDHGAWLMPPAAGTAARLSAGSACRAVPTMTGRVAPDSYRDHLISRFTAVLADLDPARVTGAADSYYLSDAAGRGPRLTAMGDGATWAYPACGGMSFKIAPLVARALADRAMGRPPRPAGLDPIDRPWQFGEGRDHEAARTRSGPERDLLPVQVPADRRVPRGPVRAERPG